MKNRMLPIFALFFALYLPFLAVAQPQYSYTAASPIANTIPFASGTTANLRQIIYYPADFPGAPSGTITAVAFQASAAGTPSFSNLTVKLGTTTLTSYANGTYLTGLTTVYNGPYTAATVTGNWVMITLQTTYFYNNSQNLVVEVSQTGYSPGFNVNQTNTTPVNRSVYGSSTATSGNVQVRLAHFGFNIISGPFCAPATGLASSNITMTGATLNWNAVSGSQGYEYALTTSAPPPVSGTPISGTTHNATGLNVGTNYWFHVRNKCSATSYSAWTSTSFSTLACPGAGAPAIVTNVPGSVTFNWPGTTNPGVVNYQYAVTGSAAVPTVWQTTTATTATVPGLTPGNTYYAHVRSNCQTNTSTDQFIQFVNPFPPCYAPASIVISSVNMHGAYIRWNRSVTVPAAQGYQYAINSNPNPPASGTPTADTFVTPTTLTGGQQYFVHVRTHCGTTNFSPWITDSFFTPANCLPTPAPTVSNITPYTADIAWEEYPGINGYEYIIDNSPTAPVVAGAAINYTALAAANLHSGTAYYFHLRVRCDAANFSPYTTTAFTTPAVCTMPPTNVVMTAMTPTTATFGWTPVSGAQQYQYSVTTTPTPVAGNHFVTPPTVKVLMLTPNTLYYFHVRASCSASDTSGWETIPFSTAQVAVGAVAGAEDLDLRVYPNPVADKLHIEISGPMKDRAFLMLHDLSGKLLLQKEIDGPHTELDISNLARGSYVLRYRDGEGSGTMLVQKL